MHIVKATIAHLSGVLDARVSASVPASRPDKFVTVERTGGYVSLTSDQATLTLQAWARDRQTCETLAESVVSAMLDMPSEIEGVMRVDIDKRFYPETVDGYWPRYVFTATVYC